MLNSHDIIIRPIISERSMDEAEFKKYIFEVNKRTTKSEVKKAVETIFGVKVKSVNTMNVIGKVKRQGATEGKRPDWKKAIVTLTEDSKAIDFFEGM